MHILIIPSEEFVPKYSPTAGIFQYHQAVILNQAGHKVGVISIRQSFSIPMITKAIFSKMVGKRVNNAANQYSLSDLIKLGYSKINKPEQFIEIENEDGFPVYRIDGFFYTPPVDHKNHFGWKKAGMVAFKQYIATYGKPDIVYAHNAIYAGMLAKKIKEGYNIPYMILEHSTAYARKLISDNKVLDRVKDAYENSLVAMAISKPFCTMLNEQFKMDRFCYLPEVLDPEFESLQYTAEDKNINDFVFLNIALLQAKKDHAMLIKAFKRIYDINKNVRLWIGGDGEMAEELKNLVKAEQLQGVVVFLGLLDRKQVIDYINKCDCFVLPSKFETFGVVVIEAMLFGKPVIVTRCGGPESFVTPDSGIVIDKENEDQLVEAMTIMLSDYNIYKNEKIRSFTINEFGKERFLNRFFKLYEEAI